MIEFIEKSHGLICKKSGRFNVGLISLVGKVYVYQARDLNIHITANEIEAILNKVRELNKVKVNFDCKQCGGKLFFIYIDRRIQCQGCLEFYSLGYWLQRLSAWR